MPGSACRRHRTALDRLRRPAGARSAHARRARPSRALRALRATTWRSYALTIVALRRAGRELARRPRAGRRRRARRAARPAPERLVVAPAGRGPAHLCGDRRARGPASTRVVDLARRRRRIGQPIGTGRRVASQRSHAWRRDPTCAPVAAHREPAAPLPRRPDSGRGRRCQRPTLRSAAQRRPEPAGTFGPVDMVGNLTPVGAVSDPRAQRSPHRPLSCACAHETPPFLDLVRRWAGTGPGGLPGSQVPGPLRNLEEP